MLLRIRQYIKTLLLIACVGGAGSAAAQVEVTTFVKYKSYMIPIKVMVDPVSPTGFKAEVTKAYTIDIQWHSHLAAEEFILEWKKPGTSAFTEIYRGLSNRVIRQNLELGLYQFRVQACGATVCAPVSSVLSATIEHPNDEDLDGILDHQDDCPATVWGQLVDDNGCSDAQIDSDNDGVADILDLCENTAAGVVVSARGCAPTTIDSDSDGITNDIDACQATTQGESVNQQGCSVNDQGDLDFDGDDIPNSEDPYPLQNAYECPIQ